MYTDDEAAAALYDVLYPRRQDYDFYLPLVMEVFVAAISAADGRW
jgi:hypothetical protein